MKKKVIIITLIVLCLVGTIWYHRAIPMKETMSFCNLAGDVIEINFDVTCHPSFFSPTQLIGTITIEDDIYTNSLNSRTKYDTFWAGFQAKLKYDYAISNFVKLGSVGTGDHILVSDIIDDFKYVCIVVKDDTTNSSVNYYGPAENKETAHAIMTEIVKELTN